jgi:hypothetical protein
MLGRERLIHLVPDRGLKYANDNGGLGFRFINFQSLRRWVYYVSIKLTSTRDVEKDLSHKLDWAFDDIPVNG